MEGCLEDFGEAKGSSRRPNRRSVAPANGRKLPSELRINIAQASYHGVSSERLAIVEQSRTVCGSTGTAT